MSQGYKLLGRIQFQIYKRQLQTSRQGPAPLKLEATPNTSYQSLCTALAIQCKLCRCSPDLNLAMALYKLGVFAYLQQNYTFMHSYIKLSLQILNLIYDNIDESPEFADVIAEFGVALSSLGKATALLSPGPLRARACNR